MVSILKKKTVSYKVHYHYTFCVPNITHVHITCIYVCVLCLYLGTHAQRAAFVIADAYAQLAQADRHTHGDTPLLIDMYIPAIPQLIPVRLVSQAEPCWTNLFIP